MIGYPARDSRVPDAQLMQSIFGDVYDKKRLAPGQVTKAQQDVVLPRLLDARRQLGIGACSTWRRDRRWGCTSPGRFLEANYAVPAAVVAARLEQVLRPRPGRPPGRPPHAGVARQAGAAQPTAAARPAGRN